MFLESLLRLAQILDEFDKKGEKLISESFHKETEQLLISQSAFLAQELEFKKDNPGPYDFGFGNLVITIFSPEQTDVQEWAVIAREGKWQKNYRFNSIMGLIKVLSLIVDPNNLKQNGTTE